MVMSKQDALNKIAELKKYISEIEKGEIKTYTKEDLVSLLREDVEEFNKVVNLKSDGGSWEDLTKVLDKLDLRDAGLNGANLHGADLSDADLSRANLRGTNLSRANLHGADLSDADLSRANLHGADLSDAELMNARFYGRYGTGRLTKEQVPDFLSALGFVVEG